MPFRADHYMTLTKEKKLAIQLLILVITVGDCFSTASPHSFILDDTDVNGKTAILSLMEVDGKMVAAKFKIGDSTELYNVFGQTLSDVGDVVLAVLEFDLYAIEVTPLPIKMEAKMDAIVEVFSDLMITPELELLKDITTVPYANGHVIVEISANANDMQSYLNGLPGAEPACTMTFHPSDGSVIAPKEFLSGTETSTGGDWTGNEMVSVIYTVDGAVIEGVDYFSTECQNTGIISHTTYGLYLTDADDSSDTPIADGDSVADGTVLKVHFGEDFTGRSHGDFKLSNGDQKAKLTELFTLNYNGLSEKTFTIVPSAKKYFNDITYLTITLKDLLAPGPVEPISTEIAFTDDIDGNVNITISWKIESGSNVIVAMELVDEMAAVTPFYTTNEFATIGTLFMMAGIDTSSLTEGEHFFKVKASNGNMEELADFQLYIEDVPEMTTTTTSTTTTTTPTTPSTTTPTAPTTAPAPTTQGLIIQTTGAATTSSGITQPPLTIANTTQSPQTATPPPPPVATTTTTPTTTPTTEAPDTITKFSLAQCDLVTRQCAFQMAINPDFYKSCSLLEDETENVILKIDCGSPLVDCAEKNEFTFIIEVSEGVSEVQDLEFNCDTLIGDSIKIDNVTVNAIEDFDSFALPSTEQLDSDPKSTRVHFQSLDGDITSSTAQIREYAGDFIGDYVSANITCDTALNACDIINPSFMSTDTIQELCISVHTANSYINLCRYLLVPTIEVKTEKRLYKRNDEQNIYDTFYPMKFQLNFKPPVQGAEYSQNIEWVCTQGPGQRMYENPSLRVLSAADYEYNVTMISDRSFPVVASGLEFSMEAGINVTFDVTTSQTVNETVFFTVTVNEFGDSVCMLLFLDDENNETIGIDVGHDKALCTQNYTITKWIEVPGLTGGLASPITFSIEHVYKTERVYDTTFIAYNPYNHLQINTIPIFVSNLNCESPKVTLLGIKTDEMEPTEFYRFEAFTIELQYDVRCGNDFGIDVSWKIQNGDSFEENFISENIKYDQTTIFQVPGATLKLGKTRICAHVAMGLNGNIFTEKCGYVLVKPSPLKAFIKNGNELLRSMDLDYEIDGSESVDPDSGTLEGVEIFILCRGVDELEIDLSYQSLKDLKTIYANSMDTSGGGCYGNGIGKLRPNKDDSTKAVIDIEKVIPSKKLQIRIVLFKKDVGFDELRTKVFEQIVTFTPQPIPGLNIKCIENCGTFVNYNHKHVLTTALSDPSVNVEDINFLWKIYICTDETAQDCTQVSGSVHNKIQNGDRNSRFFAANAASYEPKKWYKVEIIGERNGLEGKASFAFYVNRPPHSGTCTTDIDSGTYMGESFTLSCKDWLDDELPLSYNFYSEEKGSLRVFYSGSKSVFKSLLPLGNPENGYDLLLKFAVIDRLGGKSVVTKLVQVNPPSDIMAIIKNITEQVKRNDSLLKTYSKSGDITKAANMIFLLTSVLTDISKSLQNPQTEEELEAKCALLEARTEFLVALAPFQSTFRRTPVEKQLTAITQLSGTISSITTFPTEISADALELLMDWIREFHVVIMASNEGGEALQTAATGQTSLIGDISEVCSYIVNVNKRDNDTSDAAILKSIKSAGGHGKLIEDCSLRLNETREILKSLQYKLERQTIPGGDPLNIVTQKLSLSAAKVKPGQGAAELDADGIKVKMNTSGMFGDQEFVGMNVKKIETNPYTEDPSAARMKSAVTGMKISAADGSDLEVSGTSEPIVISVVNKKPENPPQPDNMTLNVSPDGDQWGYTSLQMENTSLRIILDMENTSIPVTVYIRRGKLPTTEKFDYIFELPDNSSCEWIDKDLHGDEEINLIYTTKDEVICKEEPYKVFLDDREELYGTIKVGYHFDRSEYQALFANDTEDEETDGVNSRKRRGTTIDVDKVDEDFCVVVLPPPPTPPPTDPPGSWGAVVPVITNDSIEFKNAVSFAKCLFYNETTGIWSSNGCYVGPNTTPEVTECLCDHLTDFGGDLVVAPAPIDFGKVFAGLKNLGDNLGVLMVILVICLLYVLFVVWARKKDRKDKEQSGPVVIDCMKGRGGGHPYLVTIVTGSGLNAGTTANIYCKFSGSKQDSKIIPLKATDDRKIFKARTTTTFKIILPESVGELDYLRIFHDNKGRSPAWYLRNIVVTDLLTKQQYPFVCDSWLAVESEDGQIDKMLPIASDKELAGFHIVFAATASKGLLDGHIWFSVFTRPQGSTFTRVQRASCCLCLIYLTMVTNAMFFGAGDASPKTLLRLGNMVINITGIIIGIEASLIVIPPSMFVIEVFRRLAPPKKKQKKNEETTNNDNANDEVQDQEIEELQEYQNNLNEQEEKDEEEKKKPFQFPYFFKYIAYTVIVLASFGSALFTFFYSMMWGPKKSNQWLGSMFAGFFQSVFVIQPIKAAMLAVLFALILRKPVEQEHAEDKPVENNKDKEDDEEELEGDDDGDGMIQADEVPVIMPSESKLIRARKMKLKEKMTGKIVRDIVTYLVFLLIVSALAYSEKDPNAFWYRQDLENMFVQSSYAKSMDFNDASNPANFYLWLRDTMMTSIFVGPWYNDKLPKSFKYLDNREDLLISIPRLRQQRVKPNSCNIHPSIKGIINHCEPSYSSSNEDEEDYDVAWKHINHTRSRRDTTWFVQRDDSIYQSEARIRRSLEQSYQPMAVGKGATMRRRKSRKKTAQGTGIYYVNPAALLPDGSVISCSKRWIHYTMSELRGFPVVGKFATYHGSGYVSNLGYNEETGWTVIADLHAHNWIDQHTRAVFVEFTVYNANINLFATAFLYMEILPSGAGVPSSDFKIFNGYRYALNANMASRLLEVVFVGFVIYFTILEIKKMKKQGFAYCQGFFNVIEIILVPLYVMMFGLIIFRWLSTANNIKTFHENPKDFVSFQYSAEADAMLQGVIGIVCFLLNIKFLKYFQFAKSFYEVGLIMKSFFYPLMGFMVAFFTYFIMFATAANLGFGTQSENYHTFMRTCVTQFLHLLGATDFEEARNSGGPLFGPIYYVSYSAFVMIISFNVLMAIICGAIDEDFEEEFEKNLGDIQVVEYLMNRFKTIAGFDDDPDDDDEVDEQFENITQNYEDMDRKMRELEDTIAVFMRRVERFENHEDSDQLLCKALNGNDDENENESTESKQEPVKTKHKESNAWI